MPRVTDFTVVIDSREKKPWSFSHDSKVRKLDAGDYSLEGFQHHLRIERKGSIGEFVTNISRRDWPRFENALKKLAKYRHRVIVCDFTMSDIMAGDWRGEIPSETVLGKLSYITLEMQIPVVLAGKRGRHVAESFMLRYFNRRCRKG